MAEHVVGHLKIVIKEEKEDYREYLLPHGWRKVGKKRPNPTKTGGENWDFSVFSPDGKKFRSTIEVTKFLESNPEVKCDREVTNTSQSWSQKTPGKKTGTLEETKLKSSPAQTTPKIYENKDGILKKSGLKHDLNTSGDRTVHPRKGLMPHKDFKRQHDANGVSNFQLDHNDQIVRTSSGHPRCNYCFTPSHSRKNCIIRQQDLNGGVDRAVHPQKGLLSFWGQPRIEIDRVTKQHPTDLSSRWGSDNTPSSGAMSATEFRKTLWGINNTPPGNYSPPRHNPLLIGSTRLQSQLNTARHRNPSTERRAHYQSNTNHSRTDRPTPHLHHSTNLTQIKKSHTFY